MLYIADLEVHVFGQELVKLWEKSTRRGVCKQVLYSKWEDLIGELLETLDTRLVMSLVKGMRIYWLYDILWEAWSRKPFGSLGMEPTGENTVWWTWDEMNGIGVEADLRMVGMENQKVQDKVIDDILQWWLTFLESSYAKDIIIPCTLKEKAIHLY